MPTPGRDAIILPGSQQTEPGLSWSPDGSLLATLGDDNQILLWNSVTGDVVLRLQASSPPSAGLVFSPDGSRLATALCNGQIGLWDTQSGRPLPVACDTIFGNTAIAWSRDRSAIACVDSLPEHCVHLRDCYSGKPKRTLYTQHETFCVSWSPDGAFVAAAGDSPYIGIWNVATGSRKRFEGLAQQVFALAWSPDGTRIASGGDDNYIYLWDVARRKVSEVLEGHTDSVVALDFSWNGEYLASKALDGTLRIRRLAGNSDSQQVIHEPAVRNHRFWALAFHPHTLTLASAEWPGGRVRIRSLESTPEAPKAPEAVAPGPPEVVEVSMPEPSTSGGPVELFVSYSHKDEALRKRLDPFLGGLQQKGLIRVWSDRKIVAGSDWRKDIDAHLNVAGIVLLLITQNFIDSEYCSLIETGRALERRDQGRTRVVPILMRATDWEDSNFSGLQVLPDGAKPVMSWSDKAAALTNVAKGIRKVVDDLRGKNHK